MFEKSRRKHRSPASIPSRYISIVWKFDRRITRSSVVYGESTSASMSMAAAFLKVGSKIHPKIISFVIASIENCSVEIQLELRSQPCRRCLLRCLPALLTRSAPPSGQRYQKTMCKLRFPSALSLECDNVFPRVYDRSSTLRDPHYLPIVSYNIPLVDRG